MFENIKEWSRAFREYDFPDFTAEADDENSFLFRYFLSPIVYTFIVIIYLVLLIEASVIDFYNIFYKLKKGGL